MSELNLGYISLQIVLIQVRHLKSALKVAASSFMSCHDFFSAEVPVGMGIILHFYLGKNF